MYIYFSYRFCFSQKKVQEQAEEALRLAKSRASAGTATQLDVLSAETALTEARTTQIQAQYDYAVAVALTVFMAALQASTSSRIRCSFSS